MEKTDRGIIRAVCKLMGLIWKEGWYETDDFISIPAWGRRFWFTTENGVEFISDVETFAKM